MFGLKRKTPDEDVVALKDELRKSRQEREAARLGLVTAVQKLMNELQSFPLERQVEMVAKDLAAVGKEGGDDERA